MSKPWIRYTCSRDVGCEITGDEFDAYLDLVAQALVAAFPGADVEVDATDLSSSKASAEGVDERDVKRIAQDVWEAGEFWIVPMTEARAIELGTAGGIADADTVFDEQGLDVIRQTLAPGHVAWDEAAINAGAAEVNKVPAELHDAYYAAYTRAGAKRAQELADEHGGSHA